MVTLNDKANYLTRIKASKKGQNALYYQQILATVSKVLAANLNKILTVQSNYACLNVKYYVSLAYAYFNTINFYTSYKSVICQDFNNSELVVMFFSNFPHFVDLYPFRIRLRSDEDKKICFLFTRFWNSRSVLRSVSATSLQPGHVYRLFKV